MATKTKTRRRRSSVPVIPIVLVAVVILLLVAFLIQAQGGGFGAAEGEAFGDVEVSGEALPQMGDDPTQDAAVGSTAPEFSGTDHDGTPVDVEWDGTPKALLFLAHWCPACQDEVPWVQEAADEGVIPDDVEVISVTTWTDSSRQMFPPQAWLEDEGWTLTNVADDEDFTVADAYGMNASPFWVLVDGDGAVLVRIPGGVGEEQFPALLDELSAQAAR